jgi:hypothetical protein
MTVDDDEPIPYLREFGAGNGPNRRLRRAAKALSRGKSPDLEVAVHEAGHCVGRYLTANSLGWDAEAAIAEIKLHPSLPGVYQGGGITWGQFLSKSMHDFMTARAAIEASGQELLPLFAEMRASGIDLDWWFRAKSIELIFGPMAEARLIQKSFGDVWTDATCEGDFQGIMHAGKLCGMTVDQIFESIDANISLAEQFVAPLMVWNAIMALARRLEYGRMSGRVAVATIRRAGLVEHAEVPA